MSSSYKVELYVYDLSGGLARAMSMPLLGKQIDGIWHTSVVVYGREIFYGQGILEQKPGMTHHGAPLHRLDMGTTEISEEIFEEYLTDLKELYTADRYHLLRYNCNNFTADVVGFLTGGTIPEWVSSLPEDVMNTPFGASLRPQIEAMFARGAPQSAPQAPAPSGDIRGSILSAIASQAAGTAIPTPPDTRATSTPTPANQAGRESSSAMSPLIISTNLPSFETALRSHRCVVALFIPPGAGSTTEEKWLEQIGQHEARRLGQVGFVKVDEAAGNGKEVADHYRITRGETPVFAVFDGFEKINEVTGLDEENLKAIIELHIEECL